MTTVSKLCDIINALEDTGAMLEDESQEYKKILKNYDEHKQLFRVIALAAATAFNKDYCTDELFSLFPEGTNFELVWEALDEAFVMLFGKTMGQIERGLYV